MQVGRTAEHGIYVYLVADANPGGQIDRVMLWRTPRGYFGEITLRNGAPSIPFDAYPSWGEIKSDLMTCLREELQCPEFDEESQLRPPLLRQLPNSDGR